MSTHPSAPAAPPAPTVPSAPAGSRPRGVDRWFFIRIGLQVGGFLLAGVLLIVLLGVAQWLNLIGAADPAATATANGAGETVYTCPMHPQIRQPDPGRCPICGMALELATTVTADDLEEYAVHVEPAARRLANIQTAEVVREPVTQTIDTVGAIALDESRLATISAYVPGRIERLFADYTGVEVAQGDHLVVLYSPALYAAQVEYLESRRSLEALGQAALAAVRRTQARLVENARHRLAELGMTEAQIAELERSGEAQSRLTIYSPIGGTVLEKPAVEGRYVEVGEPFYRIADLSTVWLMLQLFPEDAARIRFAQTVEAEVQSLPGEVFIGRVAFINPVVDERTRTIGVRVEMTNPQRLLRPGDYAQARIRVPLGSEGEVYDADLAGKWISPMHPQIIRDEPGECPICGMDLVPTSRYGFADEPVDQPAVLTAPRDALLTAGNRSLVYVETEPGRFEIRIVTVGAVLRDRVVLVEGVEEGEMVATSGNFLIDSQMQLAGKPSLIDPERAIARPPTAPDAPLNLDEVEVERLAGPVGERLEEFYQAYFPLQEALAADRLPIDEHVAQFNRVGNALVESPDLPGPAQEHVGTAVENAAHLHHLELDDAREHFKPVSHSVLQLAARYRGEGADDEFIHYWCEMVPGGGGDWMQPGAPPANPYWGSRMLRCVQHEGAIPLAAAAPQPSNADSPPPQEHIH